MGERQDSDDDPVLPSFQRRVSRDGVPHRFDGDYYGVGRDSWLRSGSRSSR
jgi:hypothetical protein